MSDIVDLLFDMDGEHHNRASGKSRRHEDLRRLSKLLNGNLLEGGLVHFCWEAEEGRPCCGSRGDSVDKVIFACSCALFGECDPIPCESRWTNLSANMKKTLLRSCADKVGLDAFGRGAVGGTAHEGLEEVDAAASDNYNDIVNKTRMSKTRAYFADARSLHELAVYVVVLDVVDTHLLFPFLGDALQEGNAASKPRKLEFLLHPTESKIGKCLHDLQALLANWTAGTAAPQAWCLLDVLRAPLQDESFLRWARSQLVRLSSALFRRYEVRFTA